MIRKLITLSVFIVAMLGLTACDSEPPTLMKATKQFESTEIRDRHVTYMRKNHMDALKHKRDETMYKGIRTEKNSINACINCHVPESYNGKVLRHTDQEHFCTTCHTYVAAKLDCFDCHVDHPIKTEVIDVAEKITDSVQLNQNVTELSKSELLDLANRYAKPENVDIIDHSDKSDNQIIKVKPLKSEGVSLSINKQSLSGNSTTTNNTGAINE